MLYTNQVILITMTYLYSIGKASISNTALLVIAAFPLIVIFCQLTVPFLMWKNYGEIQQKTKLGLQHDNQHFQFKSIIWVQMAVLSITVIIIMIIDYHHFVTVGLNWRGMYQYLYHLINGAAFVILLIDITSAVGITIKAHWNNELIEVPHLLCIVKEGSPLEKHILIFYQFLFLMTVMLATSIMSFHLCGIAFAVLAHPTQVIATTILAIITFVFLFTFLFEKYERNIQK